ncbi:retron system putative HNH endonuclease [Brumimicrobium mesophilum]|uniref:retron system putative HNH endonuclease n=1 Tax=Brumimicrobium mesophilum TaxID=392717 RepID=UPI000D141C80|nr:retron system putative HNH endonuclease [Brumimicrobium mesophilum]
MIRIIKNLANPPSSLIIPHSKKQNPRKRNTTHKKRLEIIDNKKYVDNKNYNSRYKLNDVREALLKIYNHKCAYCEQRIEQYHVDHFRPKSIYYWLAFSWDNLLISCPKCNENKGKKFDIDGKRIVFDSNENNLTFLNKSSVKYDLIEKPKMINPERVDISNKICFQVSGKIFSSNKNFGYTIESCGIDRKDLNDQRRKIIDDFERDITSIKKEFKKNEDKCKEYETIIRKFIRDSKCNSNEFLAFRNFAIKNDWLRDIILKK